MHVDHSVRRYLVQLVQATRTHASVYLGASPRGSIALYKASQALAFVSGRRYVVPDDIRYLAPFVLEHRILLSADARLSGVDVHKLLTDLTSRLPVPVVQGANPS